MLMLKEPMRLKSLLGITYNDAFSDKIRANYEFMTAMITKEELLHLLLGEPEQAEQKSSVTMIVENTAVVNQNEIIIELINQVLNRILMIGESGITYQDNVYIECVLRKLGITDIHTFLERIRNRKEEYFLKNHLLKKYEQEKNFLKICKLTENRNPKNQTNIDKMLAESLEKKEENYLYEKVIQRLCTMEIYQIVSQWNYTQGAGQKILFHNELALSEQQENVLNMRLTQEKREYVYPHCQMDFISSNLYETELPDNIFSGKENIAVEENNVSVMADNISVTREKVFTYLLEAALFSLVKSVCLAAVFRQVYGKKENYWFEMGFEICNIVKNTLNRCQWQYQNQQILNTGDIQKFLEQQNYLYRYELNVLQRLTENKEGIKGLLIYKENIKEKELKNSLEQNSLSENKLEQNYLEQSNLNQDNLEQNVLNENWLEQNNFKQNDLNQNKEERSSLDNKEITLKLKEILNGKNIEAIRSAERWKKVIESFRAADKENYKEKESTEKELERKEQQTEKKQIEKWQVEKELVEKILGEKEQIEKKQKGIQERKDEWKKKVHETENEKSQEKWYTENKKTIFDLYFETQRIGMAENYLGKYFRISGKQSKEIEESLAIFEKLPIPVSKLIEEIFLKGTKNREQFYQSWQKQDIEYFSENQFEEESKQNKWNNNGTENNFSQNNIIFPQIIQTTENKLREDKQRKDNLEVTIEKRINERTAEEKQIQIEKRTNEKIEKEKLKIEELQRKHIKEKQEDEKVEKEKIQREKTEKEQNQIEKKNKEQLWKEKKNKREDLQREKLKIETKKIQRENQKKEKMQIDKSEKEKLQIEKFEKEELQKEDTTEKIQDIFNELTVQNRIAYKQKEDLNISEQNNLFFNTESNLEEQPSILENQDSYEIYKNQATIIEKPLLVTENQNLYEISENQTNIIENQKNTEYVSTALHNVKLNEKEISEKNIKEIQQVFHELNLPAHQMDYKESTADTQSLNNSVSFVKTQSESAVNQSVLKSQNHSQVSEILTDVVEQRIMNQDNTDMHNPNQIKKEIQKQTDEEIVSKNVQGQAAEMTEKMLEEDLVLEHMSVIETEKGIQKEIQKEAEKDTQKEVIQQIFHEIETEILSDTQKNAQNLQKDENYFYKTKAAEIIYHQIRSDMPEPEDLNLNENITGNANKTITVTEKILSQNKIKISKPLVTDQSQTKTNINQINEAVQVIQSNIQKHINQITEQVYQKIEKKLQNERRRRGL